MHGMWLCGGWEVLGSVCVPCVCVVLRYLFGGNRQDGRRVGGHAYPLQQTQQQPKNTSTG